jgi:hypothetical protein
MLICTIRAAVLLPGMHSILRLTQTAQRPALITTHAMAYFKHSRDRYAPLNITSI